MSVAVAAVVTILAATGVLPRWPGLVHEVAIPPLDLFADVRVLVAQAASYPVFGLGVIAALAVRVCVLAVVLGRVRRALLVYVLALGPAVLAAGLQFSALAVLFHWYFWAGAGVVVLAMCGLAPVAWPAGDRLFTVSLYFLGLVVLGAIASGLGELASVLLVPVSAAMTGVTIRRLMQPRTTRPRPRMAFVAVALVLVVALAVAIVQTDGRGPAPEARGGSLLLMPGVASRSGTGSLVHLDPRRLGYSCAQTFYYSYRGPGPGAPRRQARCPIETGARYRPEDTQRSRRELSDALVHQVAALPTPVVVVTHSQTAWIAWSALADGRLPAVEALVMLAPFPDTPLSYPRRGDSGSGVAGGWFLRVLSDIARDWDISRFNPDAPLARELLAQSGAIGRVLQRSLPDTVRALAVVPMFDLPLMPDGRVIGAAANACPVITTHSGLPTTDASYRVINRFLDGEPLGSCPRWRSWIGAVSAPFGVPPARD